MRRAGSLALLGALALAGFAVEGWALADGKKDATWVAAGDDDDRIERKIVIRRDGEDDPFEVMIFGDETGGGAFLGVSTREETKLAEGGARVVRVYPDTPAAKAGLEEGDVIVAFDGKPVRGPAMLTEKIHAAKPGDRVSLEVVRDGSRRSLSAELGERKGMRIVAPRFEGKGWNSLSPEERARIEEEVSRAQEEARKALENLRIEIPGNLGEDGFRHEWRFFGFDRPRMGVELVETTPELRRHLGAPDGRGILVGKVLEGTPAEKAGVRVGDVVTSIAGRAVESASDLVDGVRESEGKTVDLEVVRDRRAMRLTITIPEREKETLPRRPKA